MRRIKVADLESTCEHCKKHIRSNGQRVPLFLKLHRPSGETYRAHIHAACSRAYNDSDVEPCECRAHIGGATGRTPARTRRSAGNANRS